MPNPLAIGVTLGGQLLDVVVPRPKPRLALPLSSLLSQRTVTRTVPATSAEEFGDARLGAACASGGAIPRGHGSPRSADIPGRVGACGGQPGRRRRRDR